MGNDDPRNHRHKTAIPLTAQALHKYEGAMALSRFILFFSRIGVLMVVFGKWPLFLGLSCGFFGCGSKEEGSSPTTANPNNSIHRAIAAASKELTIEGKLIAASAAYMDALRIDNPLDEKDLYRGDAFDCVTFIETSIASAQSPDFETFEKYMNAIRYKNGQVDFVHRNHFTDVDWAPNNIQAGVLSEETSALSQELGLPLLKAKARVDKQAWFKGFHDLDVNLAVQNIELPYLSFRSLFIDGAGLLAAQSAYQAIEDKHIATIKGTTDEALQMQARADWLTDLKALDLKSVIKPAVQDSRILEGSVLNLVAPDYKLSQKGFETDYTVAHQVLVIRREGRLYVREASKTFRKVVEIPFENYFLSKLNNPLQKGINVLKIHLQPLSAIKQVP